VGEPGRRPDVGSGGLVLGTGPARRVRGRHGRRHVAQVVPGRLVGVGEPGRRPDVGSGGGVLGGQPHRHVRRRHRQRDVAQVVGARAHRAACTRRC
jgi:hypothetical protein